MRHRCYGAALFAIALIASTSVGAQNIMPLLRLEFSVQESNLSEVMEVLQRYAKSESFSIRDIGPRLPPKESRVVFYAILTRDDNAEIKVTNFLRKDQMLLFFYPPKGSHPEQIVEPLISELRQKWPDIHTYTGP